MAEKLLIVHGYSDGSTSFTGLGEFLIARGLYKREHVYYLDYSSMDDQATFRDFADKLDNDHRTRLKDERVDVACHSTGSLVVRAWLTLHAQRNLHRRLLDVPCPVHRLLCFAPANFGSDLAAMGARNVERDGQSETRARLVEIAGIDQPPGCLQIAWCKKAVRWTL